MAVPAEQERAANRLLEHNLEAVRTEVGEAAALQPPRGSKSTPGTGQRVDTDGKRQAPALQLKRHLIRKPLAQDPLPAFWMTHRQERCVRQETCGRPLQALAAGAGEEDRCARKCGQRHGRDEFHLGGAKPGPADHSHAIDEAVAKPAAATTVATPAAIADRQGEHVQMFVIITKRSTRRCFSTELRRDPIGAEEPARHT